jgi:MFS family permease
VSWSFCPKGGRSVASWLRRVCAAWPDVGWRLGFGIGAVLGLGILLLCRFVPESPRWLVTHGAERTCREDSRGHRKGRCEGYRAASPVAEGKHRGPSQEGLWDRTDPVVDGRAISKAEYFGAGSHGGRVLPLQLPIRHVRLGPLAFLQGASERIGLYLPGMVVLGHEVQRLGQIIDSLCASARANPVRRICTPTSPKGECGGDVQEHQLMLVMTTSSSPQRRNLA